MSDSDLQIPVRRMVDSLDEVPALDIICTKSIQK